MRSRTLLKWAFGMMLALPGLAAVAPSLAADSAVSSQPVVFDIKPQPLASALNAFAVQSHQTILFTPEIAVGKTSQGVKGNMAPSDALAKILAGTGLVSSRSPDGMDSGRCR